jgi:uncharacterized protein (TIGR02466 family)
MNTIPAFPSLIWSIVTDNREATNAQLFTFISKLRKANKSVSNSNQGGWQSDFIQLDKIPLFQTALISAINEVSKSINIKPDAQIRLNGCWVNVNPTGARNQLHTHPDSMISGVYYLKVPKNSGRIVLLDPRPQAHCISMPISRYTEATSPSYHHQPQEGEFVLFPSWLPHFVDANESVEERISVAFNMHYV